MKLAIMQPYIFPYIGYLQLVAAVDKLAFYDDVNYIKNGWINRNRLFLAGEVRYITVPLSGASPFQKINEVKVQAGELWRKKMVETIRHSYAKAPHFKVVNELVSDILFSETDRISDLACASVVRVADYLGLLTQFVMSSSIYDNTHLSAAARVIDICRQEKATRYINPPGGKDLYDAEQFRARGIELSFISPNLSPYKQLAPEFHPGLSIIDVLMMNDKETVKNMLTSGVSW